MWRFLEEYVCRIPYHTLSPSALLGGDSCLPALHLVNMHRKGYWWNLLAGGGLRDLPSCLPKIPKASSVNGSKPHSGAFPPWKPRDTYEAGKPFHPISGVNFKLLAAKSSETTLRKRTYTIFSNILTAVLIDNNCLTKHQLISTGHQTDWPSVPQG